MRKDFFSLKNNQNGVCRAKYFKDRGLTGKCKKKIK